MKVSKEEILQRIVGSLNQRQRQAVTSPSQGRLQIIAGPGTGKTKLLVSRVAHLLIVDKIKPDNMIVTTFTKKAANEMTDRLHKLLAGTDISIEKLIIGTFHSICYRIIKRYGKVLGLQNYTIADERDKVQLLLKMIEDLDAREVELLEKMSFRTTGLLKSGKTNAKYHGFDVPTIVKKISSLKSKAIMPDMYAAQADCNKALSFFYFKYQSVLAENQKLDFDDCLLKCHQLVKQYPVLNYIKHVLVDEFQDTNEIQLQLMFHFAQGHMSSPEFQHNVTIVGDPDQSIYAFRDAQSINFKKMEDHYVKMGLPVTKITLDENYRSTTDILQLSETVMRQQLGRQIKNLKSQRDCSLKPVYNSLNSSAEEAQWITYQIEHLLALPNSPIKCSDIAILVRAAFQTRALETELVKHGIPYRMIRGKAFWDRKEVQAIMDYLKVCGDEHDLVSVLRTLNYPKRSLGPKTLDKISDYVQMRRNGDGASVHDCLRALANNTDRSIKLSAKNRENIKEYVQMIDNAQARLATMETCEGEALCAEAELLFQGIYQDSTLSKEYLDENEKRLNVEEVGKQLREFVPREETLPDFIGSTDDDIVKDERNFVLQFIESIGLYESDDVVEKNRNNEEDNGDENSTTGDSKGVSVSTIHGSKGLEWPVVFVPGLSEGLLPASFALRSTETSSMEPVHEERRCFYVATTRAKTLLYISSYTEYSESFYGRSICEESRFITDMKSKDSSGMKSYQLAFKNMANLQVLYELLEKSELFDANFRLDEFYRTYQKAFKRYANGQPMTFGARANSSKPRDDNVFGGFQSAALGLASQNANKRKQNTKKLNKAPPYIPSRPTKKTKRVIAPIDLGDVRSVFGVVFEDEHQQQNTTNTSVKDESDDIVEISSLEFASSSDPSVKVEVQASSAPVMKTNLGYFELPDED
ncbi:ATP-dependent DNA helicase SRS2 [Candida viswanathii]|uniref:DNA 3'-5' helicase n=1 Tax=Candida viswanathii TaxID=5486 RepID=A0A367YFG8_9ASCO|nr:ATP-dependent DNA helicase SRS2 [Candida viswanathii]